MDGEGEKATGVDEGYTSTCSAGVSPSTSESALEGSAHCSTSGNIVRDGLLGYPTESLGTVLRVTVVTVSRKQGKRKMQQSRKKGHSQKLDLDDRWEKGEKYAEPVKAFNYLDHAKIKIPPLPQRYNVLAEREKFFNAQPEPFLTREQENDNVLKKLKATKLFDAMDFKVPKYLPVRVRLMEITENGTVLIQLEDSCNLELYKDMMGRIKSWIGTQTIKQWNTTIEKEDLVKGRLVLAFDEERRNWIRAKVVDFDDNLIDVYGVDNGLRYSLSYKNVIYHYHLLNNSPFLVQEFHLTGLESMAEIGISPFISSRLVKIMNKTLYDLEEKPKEKNMVDGDQIEDIRRHSFILKKIKKTKRQKQFSVELDLPKEVAEDVSLNMLIQQLTVDPVEDFLFTC